MWVKFFVFFAIGLVGGIIIGGGESDSSNQSHSGDEDAQYIETAIDSADKDPLSANNESINKGSKNNPNSEPCLAESRIERPVIREQAGNQGRSISANEVAAVSSLSSEERKFLSELPYQVIEHYSREKSKELAAKVQHLEKEMQDRDRQERAKLRLAKYFERNLDSQKLESKRLLELGGKYFELKFTYNYDSERPESKISMQIDNPNGSVQDRQFYPDIRTTQVIDGKVFFSVPINLISDVSAYRYALIEMPDFAYSAEAVVRFLDVNSNSWLEKSLTWVESRFE